jgi:hypothetical protein
MTTHTKAQNEEMKLDIARAEEPGFDWRKQADATS